MRLHLAFVAVAAAALASPASAALLARPGGYYYDTVLNITWSGDANYAKTIGVSDTGLISQQGASYLAGEYIYFNEARNVFYTDWRLPTLGPDVANIEIGPEGTNGRSPTGQGATGTGWGTPADSGIYSELGWMYYANLRGLPRCESVGYEPCTFNPLYGLPNHGADKGPFTNLELDKYWTGVRGKGTDSHYAFTFQDGNQNLPPPRPGGLEAAGYVWLVHAGDVAAGRAAGVPEPATWAMMIAGFGITGAVLRSRRRNHASIV